MIIKKGTDCLIDINGRREDDGKVTFFLDLGVTRKGFALDNRGRRILNPMYTVSLPEETITHLREFLDSFSDKDLQEAKAKLVKEMK